jgi:hypothetical protein
MPIEQKDLERIERIILRSTGDIAEAIGRSIERLEERIDAAELEQLLHVRFQRGVAEHGTLAALAATAARSGSQVSKSAAAPRTQTIAFRELEPPITRPRGQ